MNRKRPVTDRLVDWWMLFVLASAAVACSSASSDSAGTPTPDGGTPTADAAQVDAAQVDGAQVDGAQVDGAQVDGAQVDGAQVDGAQVDGAQVDAAQVDAAQVDADAACTVTGASVDVVSHDVVQKTDGVWMMGAANKSANQWIWGNEIVTAFDRQHYSLDCSGHNLDSTPGYDDPSWARSVDGGQTWTSFNGPVHAGGPTYPIDFTDPGFGLRIAKDAVPDGTWGGYSRSYSENWAFVITYDKWQTYLGPYYDWNDLKAWIPSHRRLTARTDYVVNSSTDIMVFMSQQDEGQSDDRVFMARSTNGGSDWTYVSQVNPVGDGDRAVMPSTVRLDSDSLLSCVRARNEYGTGDRFWIDCYQSDDNGTSWYHDSRIEDVGETNGNPPALVRLSNGLLALAYGHRSKLTSDGSRMQIRVSADDGNSWELVGGYQFRTGYHSDTCSGFWDAVDLGYPRIYELPDGQVRVVYAWSDAGNENHMTSTLLRITANCD